MIRIITQQEVDFADVVLAPLHSGAAVKPRAPVQPSHSTTTSSAAVAFVPPSVSVLPAATFSPSALPTSAYLPVNNISTITENGPPPALVRSHSSSSPSLAGVIVSTPAAVAVPVGVVISATSSSSRSSSRPPEHDHHRDVPPRFQAQPQQQQPPSQQQQQAQPQPPQREEYASGDTWYVIRHKKKQRQTLMNEKGSIEEAQCHFIIAHTQAAVAARPVLVAPSLLAWFFLHPVSIFSVFFALSSMCVFVGHSFFIVVLPHIISHPTRRHAFVIYVYIHICDRWYPSSKDCVCCQGYVWDCPNHRPQPCPCITQEARVPPPPPSHPRGQRPVGTAAAAATTLPITAAQQPLPYHPRDGGRGEEAVMDERDAVPAGNTAAAANAATAAAVYMYEPPPSPVHAPPPAPPPPSHPHPPPPRPLYASAGGGGGSAAPKAASAVIAAAIEAVTAMAAAGATRRQQQRDRQKQRERENDMTATTSGAGVVATTTSDAGAAAAAAVGALTVGIGGARLPSSFLWHSLYGSQSSP